MISREDAKTSFKEEDASVYVPATKEDSPPFSRSTVTDRDTTSERRHPGGIRNGFSVACCWGLQREINDDLGTVVRCMSRDGEMLLRARSNKDGSLR